MWKFNIEEGIALHYDLPRMPFIIFNIYLERSMWDMLLEHHTFKSNGEKLLSNLCFDVINVMAGGND